MISWGRKKPPPQHVHWASGGRLANMAGVQWTQVSSSFVGYPTVWPHGNPSAPSPPTDFQAQFGDRDPVDFAAGSVRGLRYWRSEPERPEVLQGCFLPWEPGVSTAACLRGWEAKIVTTAHGFRTVMTGPTQYTPDHRPPDEDCACGFYAYWDEPKSTLDVMSLRPGELLVQGVIEGWGQTLLGETGFRCEKARILALHVMLPSLSDMADDPTTFLHNVFGISPPAKKRGVDMSPERVGRVAATLLDRYEVPVYFSTEELLEAYPTTPAEQR